MEINRYGQAIEKVQESKNRPGKSRSIKPGQRSFQEILDRTKGQVTLSKHASNRLLKRQINLDEASMERLNNGIQSARDKGIKESLVMMDDVAYLVNVKENVVITALDKKETRNHVFTQIDGAVIM